MRKVLLSLVAAAAIGAAALTMTNANAAPISPSALAPSIEDTSLTDTVQWRRCWHNWNTSRRWCRWYGGYRYYGGPYYGYYGGYRYYRPYRYRRWW